VLGRGGNPATRSQTGQGDPSRPLPQQFIPAQPPCMPGSPSQAYPFPARRGNLLSGPTGFVPA